MLRMLFLSTTHQAGNLTVVGAGKLTIVPLWIRKVRQILEADG